MILIAFGANLDSPVGTPSQTFDKLQDVLNKRGIKVLKTSRLWRTSPVPYDPSQPDYLNAVLSVQTSLHGLSRFCHPLVLLMMTVPIFLSMWCVGI